eukprot:2719014-Heterocapsa_arctica.AAC.1
MDEFATAGEHTSSDDLAVKEEAEPILPRPPINTEGAEKLPEVNLSDVEMDDLQTGVRKEEPTAPIRRWCRTDKAFKEEQDEERARPRPGDDNGGDINVQSDDVSYAQEHFSVNDSDWLNPDTGNYVVEMSLRELMKLRRVELDDRAGVMTIL